MKTILIFGAGKSSTYLISYLLSAANTENWQLIIADTNLQAAIAKIDDHPRGHPLMLDINDVDLRRKAIRKSDFVISLLPPHLHTIIALDCLQFSKNLATASYVSPEIKAMHAQCVEKKLTFMNEIGLDPGIDHMSAMKIIDEIHRFGGKINSFKSFCGGLVSPQSDNNPWRYKISWNPRNIVLAGKAGAHYLKNNTDVKIDYNSLFDNFQSTHVKELGDIAYYPNRDSLSYKETYGLQEISTLLRATFRYKPFMIGWNAIVKLDLTNETHQWEMGTLTYYQWFMQATSTIQGNTPMERIAHCVTSSTHAFELLAWLGLFSEEIIPLSDKKVSAEILQLKLEEKWMMQNEDKDMIVMKHEFEYERSKIKTTLSSTLIIHGEDSIHTAMAKTVGLPIAIYTKLFLTHKIDGIYGVQIPTHKKIYLPILNELETLGIHFTESYS